MAIAWGVLGGGKLAYHDSVLSANETVGLQTVRWGGKVSLSRIGCFRKRYPELFPRVAGFAKAYGDRSGFFLRFHLVPLTIKRDIPIPSGKVRRERNSLDARDCGVAVIGG